jgi:hypothetical protein
MVGFHRVLAVGYFYGRRVRHPGNLSSVIWDLSLRSTRFGVYFTCTLAA